MFEHYEEFVSSHFITKFVCSITEILSSFRKQVLFYDQFVNKPINNVSQLSEAIRLCGKLIEKFNEYNNIEISYIIDLLNFMKEIFNKWETYELENGITSFV